MREERKRGGRGGVKATKDHLHIPRSMEDLEEAKKKAERLRRCF